ncbi:unnamed protein product [Ceutorhynchus assimilis]|uniref:Uncharacterized protein n=1 Tax=Ceutorhynchus assimilis TaxID=467358 RepID=A0A9N9MUD5_9CUCU|nr:unnamed protein product [Ceutorhynchus assimilis]
MKPCHKCSKPISAEQAEKAPRCDSCRVIFHLEEKCSGLCASEQRAIVVQKRIMLFFCDDCVLSFKKIPLLTNKFIQLEEQIKSLKEEIEVIKQNNLQPDTSDPARFDSVILEIQERAERANNLMVYGVPESRSGDLQQRVVDDKTALSPVLDDIGLDQNDVVRVLRVGQLSEVENNNMKNFGNQPTKTELFDNTVSHISKFSWKTSEGKNLKLFACQEEN